MTFVRGVLLGLVLVGLGGRAAACINDSELDSQEREFRSQYGNLVAAPSQTEQPRPVQHDLLSGGGMVLLVGAFGLAAMRDRARA
jgi:hypothetical protein